MTTEKAFRRQPDHFRPTISPGARKELLKRLQALNHQRAAEEKAKAPAKTDKTGKGMAAKEEVNSGRTGVVWVIYE